MAHAVNGGLGRTARIALLLATLLGLTAMHTLGHAGPHLPDGHQHVPAAEHVATMPVLSAVNTAALDALTGCAGDGCAMLLTGSGHDHGGMDGWAICLAVLVAFAVIVLVAMLLTRRRANASPARPRATRRAGPRAPPPRPFGLTLATVSVLRT
ncbi:DUF6153 family protein [Dactylosporangium sp. NPDC000244]|uniref:DUF6153 family protein n=1 Tax=Dactylosporangium sp. NPDC000244 TaxID=3154365 RepID=UPI00331E2880